MKILAFPFNARGFSYELVERQGLVCLVKATRIGHRHYCYEVVKLLSYPDQVRFGTLIPAHECYPSDEHWGTYGFTYRPEELAKARDRFTRMASVLYGEPKIPHKSPEPVQISILTAGMPGECPLPPRFALSPFITLFHPSPSEPQKPINEKVPRHAKTNDPD